MGATSPQIHKQEAVQNTVGATSPLINCNKKQCREAVGVTPAPPITWFWEQSLENMTSPKPRTPSNIYWPTCRVKPQKYDSLTVRCLKQLFLQMIYQPKDS